MSYGPPQTVHMWQAPLSAMTARRSESEIKQGQGFQKDS